MGNSPGEESYTQDRPRISDSRLPLNVRRAAESSRETLKSLVCESPMKVWRTRTECKKFASDVLWLERFALLNQITLVDYPSTNFVRGAFIGGRFYAQLEKFNEVIGTELLEHSFCVVFDDDTERIECVVELNRRAMIPTLLLTSKTESEIVRLYNPLVFFDPFIEIYNSDIADALSDFIPRNI